MPEHSPDPAPPKRAVFTALLGGYEELLEQIVAHEDSVDYICFTDDPETTSETWQIVQVEPLFATDLVRSQRALKIRGHQRLAEYDELLYIDNSVRLKKPASVILDSWLDGADYAVSLHSYRERVIDEFDEVIALNYDDAARVQEQLFHYSEAFASVLYEHPVWNGIIARRNTPQVQATMNLWFDHVLRYSRRDQLSANVAIAASGLEIKTIEHDNFESDTHVWPVEAKRKIHMGKASRKMSGPLLAEVARLERESRELARVLEVTERLRAQLEAENRELEARRADSAQTAESLSDTLVAMQATRSWRLLSPLRAIQRTVQSRKQR